MNKKTTNEIHHQILNIYLKYLYFAFETVGSDDFGILYGFMEESKDENIKSDELLAIESFLKKEENKRYEEFKKDWFEELTLRLNKSVEYLAVKEYLSRLELFELSPKSIEMITILIIYHRENQMSYHDKEVDRLNLNNMKLKIKNDEISIEYKD